MHRLINALLLLALWTGSTYGQVKDDLARLELEPSTVKVTPNSLVVILPTISTSQRFSLAEAHILEDLTKRLIANGFRVSVLDTASYRLLLNTAESEIANAGMSHQNQAGNRKRLLILSYLAEEICSQAKCSLIIDSRLTLRPMRIKNKFAEWDGVRRRIPYTRTAGGTRQIEGSTFGLSVELLGMASSGRQIFQGFGGATIPFEVDLVSTYTQLRTNLLDDMEELEEGVSIALQPLLVQIDRR